MASDPAETVRDLRFELHELLLDLKELKFDGGADDLARFLKTTRDDEAHAVSRPDSKTTEAESPRD